jgi:hypothetical protein
VNRDISIKRAVNRYTAHIDEQVNQREEQPEHQNTRTASLNTIHEWERVRAVNEDTNEVSEGDQLRNSVINVSRRPSREMANQLSSDASLL